MIYVVLFLCHSTFQKSKRANRDKRRPAVEMLEEAQMLCTNTVISFEPNLLYPSKRGSDLGDDLTQDFFFFFSTF